MGSIRAQTVGSGGGGGGAGHGLSGQTCVTIPSASLHCVSLSLSSTELYSVLDTILKT
jgi:hypothetical protein